MVSNPGPIPVDGSTAHLDAVAVPVLRLDNPNPFPIDTDLSLLLMPAGLPGGVIPVRGAASVPASLTVPPYSATMVGLVLIGRRGHLEVELGHALAPAEAGMSAWGTRLPAVLSNFATISAAGAAPASAAILLTQRTAGPWNDRAARTTVRIFDTDDLGNFTINCGLRLSGLDMLRLDPTSFDDSIGPRVGFAYEPGTDTYLKANYAMYADRLGELGASDVSPIRYSYFYGTEEDPDEDGVVETDEIPEILDIYGQAGNDSDPVDLEGSALRVHGMTVGTRHQLAADLGVGAEFTFRRRKETTWELPLVQDEAGTARAVVASDFGGAVGPSCWPSKNGEPSVFTVADAADFQVEFEDGPGLLEWVADEPGWRAYDADFGLVDPDFSPADWIDTSPAPRSRRGRRIAAGVGGAALLGAVIVAVLFLAGVFSDGDATPATSVAVEAQLPAGDDVGGDQQPGAPATAAPTTSATAGDTGADQGTAVAGDASDDARPPDTAATTTLPAAAAAPTETYYLQMSNGEQFPIYRFAIDGAEPQLGIVIRPPDTCWVLQSGPGQAAVDGTCLALLIGGDAVPATRLLTGSDRYVLALVDSGQLAVVDDSGNQGVETDLAGQTIADAVVDGSIDIGGERFSGG